MNEKKWSEYEVVGLDAEDVVGFYEFFAVVVQAPCDNGCEDDLLDYLELGLIFSFERDDEVADGGLFLQKEEQGGPVTEIQFDHGGAGNQTLFIFDEGEIVDGSMGL